MEGVRLVVSAVMFAVPAMAPVCLFFPLLSLLKALRRLVTVSGVESASEGARQKTHRPSVGPAVTQHEVLILTGDIMSLQRYRPKSACYWCLSSYD